MKLRMRKTFFALLLGAIHLASQTKPLPPPGIPVPPSDRAELETGLAQLKTQCDHLQGNPLLPDILIFHEAVRYALQYNEFFKPDEFGKARDLLRQGRERAAQLAQNRHPWTSAPGLVVRGYISKIDRSVQPYALVVPPSYSPALPHRWRLDAWFHGRGETLSELNFLTERQRNPGEFTPADTIVLHLYGRYCNANRFAGEVDLFEALDAVKQGYAIDENRILVRGFSMGGAAVWHIAGHHAGLWTAAAPGAGFSETARYRKFTDAQIAAFPAWQRALWRLYDATGYAANFFNLPVVAYNGEIDPQKQAADMMEESMAAEGLRLERVVGPGTAHKYHPDSKVRINAILDPIAERGRDPYPRQVRFTTWTLAYNRMKWVVIDSLAKHWERARLNASITGLSSVRIESANVTAFTLDIGPGGCPLDSAAKPEISIDDQKLTVPGPFSDRSWTAHFRKTGTRWTVADSAYTPGLHKRHGLQGPIDDAFLDSFIMVRPTAPAANAAAGKWVESELQRAVTRWRSIFRGEARVMDDTSVTDAEIASANLVLWGDPSSNRVLARISDRLPVQWTAGSLTMNGKRYSSATHMPVMIYPNPLNPARYIVINSGFTFREDSNATNSLQYPHLPDYAVVDITAPPDEHAPGKIVAAGFFNEDWMF